jgi:hypothetical protein
MVWVLELKEEESKPLSDRKGGGEGRHTRKNASLGRAILGPTISMKQWRRNEESALE